jgi:transcriptional regulator with XRE-family HTH domain
MTFAELITTYRTARHMSQRQLAATTSMSVRAIRDLERGTTNRPRAASVAILADALGLEGEVRAAFARAARTAPPAPSHSRRRPANTGPLFGREADIDGVARRFADRIVRMVTVTGPVGVGKTAVARHAAARLGEYFDATVRLDLRSVPDPAGIGPAAGRLLRDNREATATLLLMDGFRHGEAAALALADLLASHPGLHILATAREPVRIRGEHVWPLGPLPWDASMAYLTTRVGQLRSGFRSTGDAGPIGSVCHRLAGMARAIELAAVRTMSQDLMELDADLAREGLPSAPADVVHRLVASAIGRLPTREVRCLAALAACPGGATPATLRRLLADTTYFDASVTLLCASGLVTVEDRAGQTHLTVVDPVPDLLTGCR